MSSHHIVRDEQEPALIIHRMEGFPFESLGALLEWSPTIVCCGPAIEKVRELGVKIDIAIVPFAAREKMQQLLAEQSPIKILSLSDTDYLSSGLQMLCSEKHFVVNVVTSDELVNEVLDLCIQFLGQLQVCVWTEKNRYTLINSSTFKKWFPTGTALEFYVVENRSALKIHLNNDKEIIESEFILASDGILTVACDTPPFVMVEKHLK